MKTFISVMLVMAGSLVAADVSLLTKPRAEAGAADVFVAVTNSQGVALVGWTNLAAQWTNTARAISSTNNTSGSSGSSSAAVAGSALAVSLAQKAGTNELAASTNNMPGGHLADGTVNSNKLDTATRALLGGAGGGVDAETATAIALAVSGTNSTTGNAATAAAAAAASQLAIDLAQRAGTNVVAGLTNQSKVVFANEVQAQVFTGNLSGQATSAEAAVPASQLAIDLAQRAGTNVVAGLTNQSKVVFANEVQAQVFTGNLSGQASAAEAAVAASQLAIDLAQRAGTNDLLAATNITALRAMGVVAPTNAPSDGQIITATGPNTKWGPAAGTGGTGTNIFWGALASLGTVASGATGYMAFPGAQGNGSSSLYTRTPIPKTITITSVSLWTHAPNAGTNYTLTLMTNGLMTPIAVTAPVDSITRVDTSFPVYASGDACWGLNHNVGGNSSIANITFCVEYTIP